VGVRPFTNVVRKAPEPASDQVRFLHCLKNATAQHSTLFHNSSTSQHAPLSQNSATGQHGTVLYIQNSATGKHGITVQKFCTSQQHPTLSQKSTPVRIVHPSKIQQSYTVLKSAPGHTASTICTRTASYTVPTNWSVEVSIYHIQYTLLKKPSVTQDQNTRVTENSIIHVERSEKSVNTRDWASLSICVTELSVTLVLWSCVTLGFFLTVKVQLTIVPYI
jgi:hypothetical protein